MAQHDYLIADAPGQPIRLDLQAALQALATLNSGSTAPSPTYPGMLWLDLSVLPDGQLRMRDQANLTWIAIAGFPPKATSAEAIAGTVDTKYVTPKGMADMDAQFAKWTRNRITNAAMQVSQQNGNSVLTASNAYTADEWRWQFNGGAFNHQRVQVTTPKGSLDRLRATVTTAVPTLAAGNYCVFFQYLEGRNVAELWWGTSAAKRVIVRFGFRGPAGTYGMSLHNPSFARYYCANFTISAAQANTDTEQVFVVPGDTTGTWPVDNTPGILFEIAPAAGSNSVTGLSGAWGAGNPLAVNTITNNIAAVNNAFDLFDVGFYVDVFGNGVPPLWEMPDPAAELLRCRRYYDTSLWLLLHQLCTSGGGYLSPAYSINNFRTTPPSLSGVNIGNSLCAAAPGGTAYYNDGRTIHEQRTATGTGHIFFETNWTVSSRM